MLLILYRVRALACLILDAYSKPFQTSKMMRHIENPGTVRTVYSGIFTDIQQYSAILRLRHIEAYSGIIEAFCAALSYSRTLAYLEP